MTWVKVCGLRERAHVLAAAEAGADAVGFVLADSPRRVTVDEARRLGRGIQLQRVLVTVDADPDSLLAAVAAAEADGVQPYGHHADEAARVAAQAGLIVLRPVRVADQVDLDGVPPEQIPLLDTGVPGLLGGTGQGFDWALIGDTERRFVLAGGLGPDNVAGAVAQLRPWGVDASSKLESAPGIKDPDRIRRFVAEAKS